MNTVTKVLIWLGILLVAAQASARTYRIGVVSWVGWSNVHVAAEKGFFQRAGIDVEVVWYPGPAEIEAAFAKGEVDFRLDFVASVVAEWMAGRDLVLLAETAWSHGGDKIIVKAGHSFAYGRGSSIAVYRDSPALTFFLELYLRQNRLRLADYKIIQVEPAAMLEAFENEKLAFLVIFDPYSKQAVFEGDGKIVANSAHFPGCLPEGIYAKRAFLESVPEQDVAALLGALADAADWLGDAGNRDAFHEILNQQVLPDQPAFTTRQLRALMASVKVHGRRALAVRNRDQGGVFRYLEKLHAFMARNDLLDRDFSAGEIIDNRYVMQALGE